MWSSILPLRESINQIDISRSDNGIIHAVQVASERLHQHHVLHLDAEPRNILYTPHARGFMIIDFERAKMSPSNQRQPLSLLSSNNTKRKRKRAVKQERRICTRATVYCKQDYTIYLSKQRLNIIRSTI